MRTRILLLTSLLFVSVYAPAQQRQLVRSAVKAAESGVARKAVVPVAAKRLAKTERTASDRASTLRTSASRVTEDQINSALQTLNSIARARETQQQLQDELFSRWKNYFYKETAVPERLEQSIRSHISFVQRNYSHIELAMSQSLELRINLNYRPWLEGKRTVVTGMTPSPNTWEQAGRILEQLRQMHPGKTVLVASQFPVPEKITAGTNQEGTVVFQRLHRQKNLTPHAQAREWGRQILEAKTQLSRSPAALWGHEPVTLILAAHPYTDGEIGELLEKESVVSFFNNAVHISLRTRQLPDITGFKSALLDGPLKQFPKPYANDNVYGALVTSFGPYGRQVGTNLLVEITPDETLRNLH